MKCSILPDNDMARASSSRGWLAREASRVVLIPPPSRKGRPLPHLILKAISGIFIYYYRSRLNQHLVRA